MNSKSPAKSKNMRACGLLLHRFKLRSMAGYFHFLRTGGFSDRQLVVAFLSVSVLSRLYLAACLPLLPDEAYYYLWSQHLDLSYFSKGPAIAYTIALGTMLLGHNALGIRLFSVLLSAGTAWQLFLLARRWFDDETGLLAVLLLSVVPLYTVGAVLMTIDPLSAFFWLWAALFFSKALETKMSWNWLGAGFAIGCGFLAKFLNGLELIAFLLFLISVPARRVRLVQPGFWWMIVVSVFCTLPVWWWNAQNGWPTMQHLLHRGDLQDRFTLHPGLFLNFGIAQAMAISPILFCVLLGLACKTACKAFQGVASEAEHLCVFLFTVVFFFYALLAWHAPEEPNWPAISYLSLILLLAHSARSWLRNKNGRVILSMLFLVGWAEILIFYSLPFLPGRLDPMSRVSGWKEVAAHLEQVRENEHAGVILADAYKEASILSFYLPGHRFIYTKRQTVPENEFYFWPTYSTASIALYITYNRDISSLNAEYNEITPIDTITIFYHGARLRNYTIYRCENR